MTAVTKMKETNVRDQLKNPDMLQSECYINGKWVSAKNGELSDVMNPATGDVITTIPKMGYDETIDAIEQANAAWGSWRHKLAGDRTKVMLKWAQIMRDNANDIGLIMAMEQGKPLDQAIGESTIPPLSLIGMPMMRCACMAPPCSTPKAAGAKWSSRNRSAYRLPSPRGTSPVRW